MVISTDDLRYFNRYSSKTNLEDRDYTKRLGLRTAFLCHSHKDADLVRGLVNKLHQSGWQVYIDWEDHSMPDHPNRETAEKIQKKISDLDFFLFFATENSKASRWCPWEIGFADAKKARERILIIPTRSATGQTHGNEYLDLYRKIVPVQGGGLGVFQPGSWSDGIYLRSL